ncbi:MAG TPA: hypothetical protein VFS02_03645, partial [Telluria sp.]|nr:hypothetical protein [Telluria sp.]
SRPRIASIRQATTSNCLVGNAHMGIGHVKAVTFDVVEAVVCNYARCGNASRQGQRFECVPRAKRCWQIGSRFICRKAKDATRTSKNVN